MKEHKHEHKHKKAMQGHKMAKDKHDGHAHKKHPAKRGK
jgi:hypothetical protein